MSSTLKQIFLMIEGRISPACRGGSAISLSMVLSVALVVAVLAGFLAMARGFEAAASRRGFARHRRHSRRRHQPGNRLGCAGRSDPQPDRRNRRDRRGAECRGRPGAVARDRRSRRCRRGRSDGADRRLRCGAWIWPALLYATAPRFRPGGCSHLAPARSSSARASPTNSPASPLATRCGLARWTGRSSGISRPGGSAFESEIWARPGGGAIGLRPAGAGAEPARAPRPGRRRLRRCRSIFRLYLPAAHSPSPRPIFMPRNRAHREPHPPVRLAAGAAYGDRRNRRRAEHDDEFGLRPHHRDRHARALGFGRLPAFTATWVEAVASARRRRALGILASWLAFNGWQASTSAPTIPAWPSS